MLEYLARYTHRVAISNERIINVTDQQVSFRYRDYADASKVKAMTLDMEEFARRFLQHVLPAGFRKVRYCGIFANRTQAVALAACRKALRVKPPLPKPKLDWKEKLYQLTGVDPTRCPRCEKGRMQLVEVIAQPRPPPQKGAVPATCNPVVVLPAIG